MLFILQLMTISGYLVNSYVGFVFSVIMYFTIWKNKSNSLIDKTITSMILSIPTYNIGFLGTKMHHMFSWFILFTFILVIYILVQIVKRNYKCSKKSILMLTAAISNLILIFIMDDNKISGVTDFIQIFIMIFITFMIYQLKKYIKIDKKNIEEWKKYINITIISIAIMVIIQYCFYNFFGIKIGYITVFPGRVIINLLFKGASVLSLILGIGITYNVNKFFNTYKLMYVINIFICVIGVLVNTSRVGLVSALIVSTVIVASNMLKNNKKFIISILTIIIGGVCLLSAIKIIENERVGEKFLDDNGRIDTYINGIIIWRTNIKTMLLGNGISPSNYKIMLPHNFIIEMLMKTGILFTILILISFFKLLRYMKKNNFKYVIWSILISSMFITTFYEMTFIIAFITVGILSTSNNEKEEGEQCE